MDADKIRPLWREALKRAQGRADAAFLADVALRHEALMASGVEVTPEQITAAEKVLRAEEMTHIGTIGSPLTMEHIKAAWER